MKPTIFLSSIMREYGEYRAAARRGIAAAGAQPLMIEDRGPLPTSSRNACLDLVGVADGLVLVVGPRGGSKSPSGKLIVQEEFDEAQRRGIPTWLFAQRGERDASARELLERLSDYVKGRYRGDFVTPSELEELCRETIGRAIHTLSREAMSPNVVQDAVAEDRERLSVPTIRLALAPTRRVELVDPLRLDDEDLQRSILKAAHEARFFDYGFASSQATTADSLTISQADRREGIPAAIRLVAAGLITAQRRVGTRGDQSEAMLSDMFELLASDLTTAVGAALAITSMLVDLLDPHDRFPDFHYNVALLGSGSRRIVDSPARKSSYSAGFAQVAAVTAYEEPRSISRVALREYRQDAERVVAMLRRRLNDELTPEWQRR